MCNVTSEIFNCLTAILLKTAPDGWLGFIGSILGAVATIAAVIITIKNESKRQKKNDILKSKPWITSKNNILSISEDLDEIEDESIVYIYKNCDNWCLSHSLSNYLISKCRSYNRIGAIIKYEFTNVGGNTATYLNFMINGEIILPQFALAVGDKVSLVLFLPLINNKDTEYKLKLEYGDVVSNTKYYQQEAFLVEKTNGGVTVSQKIENLISAPQVLNNEQKNISKLKQLIFSKNKEDK